jgi:hypothetical protein
MVAGFVLPRPRRTGTARATKIGQASPTVGAPGWCTRWCESFDGGIGVDRRNARGMRASVGTATGLGKPVRTRRGPATVTRERTSRRWSTAPLGSRVALPFWLCPGCWARFRRQPYRPPGSWPSRLEAGSAASPPCGLSTRLPASSSTVTTPSTGRASHTVSNLPEDEPAPLQVRKRRGSLVLYAANTHVPIHLG